ncbi:MAG TPA: replication/maintenance protein [Cyanobacteria bacterium UBA11049]|nr:replication/maintenance protein [Cyanobacteria bacterium UBA11049]
MTILLSTPTVCYPPPVRLFSRCELIPLERDVLWRIERGAIRTLTWNSLGSLITLGYWGDGDVVGQPITRMQVYEIQCLTSVEASILPKELWHQALPTILRQAQQTEELLSIIHCQSTYQKAWKFLVSLSQKFGRDVELGRLIDLPITHAEIAETIGTTRVTVTRTLQQFEAEGKLRRQKRRLILCQG